MNFFSLLVMLYYSVEFGVEISYKKEILYGIVLETLFRTAYLVKTLQKK